MEESDYDCEIMVSMKLRKDVANNLLWPMATIVTALSAVASGALYYWTNYGPVAPVK